MKTYTNFQRPFISALSLVAFLVASLPAFADGSRNMYPADFFERYKGIETRTLIGCSHNSDSPCYHSSEYLYMTASNFKWGTYYSATYQCKKCGYTYGTSTEKYFILDKPKSGYYSEIGDRYGSNWPTYETDVPNDRRAVLYSAASEGTPYCSNAFPTYGTIKVYAKVGEHIYLASSALGIGNGKIAWRSPDGGSGQISNKNNGGYIANRKQELAGPKFSGSTNSDCYDAYKITVQEGQEGVWEVDFYAPDIQITNSNQLDGQGKITITGDWYENSYKNSNVVSAFDISVSDEADSNLIEGRVYANVLNLYIDGSSSFSKNWFTTLYMLTDVGYVYEVRPNGQNGCAFTFFGNNKGYQNGGDACPIYYDGIVNKGLQTVQGGEAAYKSVSVGSQPSSISTYDPRKPDNLTVGHKDVTHKIFFCKPAKDMPSKAACVYGTTVDSTWLYTKLNTDMPELSDISVVGVESGKENLIGPDGAYIKFTSSVASDNVKFVLNFNESKYETRTLFTQTNGQPDSVFWDGKDGKGVLFQGDGDFSIQGNVTTAEIHFPFIDVEQNKNGFYIDLLDRNFDKVIQDTMFYDDKQEGVANREVHLERDKGGDGGVCGPAHKWASSKGNECFIDTWTHIDNTADVTLKAGTISRTYIDLEVSDFKTTISRAYVGDLISFTFKVYNRSGNATFKTAEGETLDVELTADAVDASVGIWFQEGGFYTTSIGLGDTDDTNCKIVAQPSGDAKSLGYISLANGKYAYVTVTGYVGAKFAHQVIKPIGFVMRPGDYYEIDSENVSGDGLPSNPLDEYTFENSNNLVDGILIEMLNSLPSLRADNFIASDGVSCVENLMANDIDNDDDDMVVTSFTIEDVFEDDGVTPKVFNAGQTVDIKDVGTLTIAADGTATLNTLSQFKSELNGTYTVSDQYDGSAGFADDAVPGKSTQTYKFKFNPNQAPIIDPIYAEIVSSSKDVLVPIDIYDPEGEPITVQIEGIQSNNYYVKENKIYYNGGVKKEDQEPVSFTVIVSDGVNVRESVVTVKVKANQPPYIDPIVFDLGVPNIEGSYKGGTHPLKIQIHDPENAGIDLQKFKIGSEDGSQEYFTSKYNDGNIYFVQNSESTPSLADGEYSRTITYYPIVTLYDAEGIEARVTLTVNVIISRDPNQVKAQCNHQDGEYGDKLGDLLSYELVSGIGCEGTWKITEKIGSVFVSCSLNDYVSVGSHSYTVTFTPSPTNYYGLKDDIVLDAPINVSKRPIRLESFDAERIYDGATCHNYDVEATYAGSKVGVTDAFVNGDDFIYSCWKSVTEVGTYENTFCYSAKGTTDIDNYEVVDIKYGTLTIKPVELTESDLVVTLDPEYFYFSGEDCIPKVSVTTPNFWGEIQQGVDYNVAFRNNKLAGTAEVVITDAQPGAGNVEFKFEGGEFVYNFPIYPRPVSLDWKPQSSWGFDGVQHQVYAEVANPAPNYAVAVLTYKNDTATNVGNYTAQAFGLTDEKNYVLHVDSSTFDWSITTPVLKNITVNYERSWTYTSKEIQPKVTITAEGPDGKTITIPSTEYSVTYDNNINVTEGEEAKIIIANVAGNYEIPDLEKYFAINPAEITPVWDNLKFTFGGTRKQVKVNTFKTLLGSDACDVVTIEGDTATNVGTYTVTILAISNSNYKLAAGTETATWNILEATTKPSVTFEPASFIYDGNPCEPKMTLLSQDGINMEGEFDYAYLTSNVNAGTVQVKFTDKDGGNFTFDSFVATFTIKQRDVTLTSRGNTWTYDGAEHQEPYVDADNMVPGESFEFTNFAKITNVGKIDNTFDVASSATADINNYNISIVTKELVVEACPVNVEVSLSEDEFTYNGTEQKPSTVTVTATVGGKTVTLTEGVDYTIEWPTNLIDAETKNCTIVDKASNYKVTAKDFVYEIKPIEVTLVSQPKFKTYDGTPLTYNVVLPEPLGAFVGTEGFTYLCTGTITEVGSTPNTFTYQLKANTKEQNYSIKTREELLTIGYNNDDLDFVIEYETIVYSGNDNEPAVSNVKVGSIVLEDTQYSVTYSTDTKNVGSKLVTVKVTDPNYSSAAQSKSYEVTALPVQFVWSANSLPYNGEVQTITATIQNLAAGDVCDFTVTGNSGKDVQAYTAKVTVLKNSNYTLVGATNVSHDWEITSMEVGDLEILIADGPFVFSGEEKKPSVTSVKFGDVTLSPSDYTVTYDNNIKATESAVVKIVAANSNLTFNGSTEKLFTIEPLPLTVVWPTTLDYTYNGIEQGGFLPSFTNLVLGYADCVPVVTGNKATNAGSYQAKLTGISGSDASNYKLVAESTKDWQIKRKAIAASEYTIDPIAPVTYNGTAQEPAVNVTINGESEYVDSSEYAVSYSDNKDAGAAHFTVTDNGTGNYAFADKSGDFTIEPVKITLTAASHSWDFDGKEHSDHNVTYTSGSTVGSETLSFKGFPSITNFGTVENTFSVVYENGAKEINYDITIVKGELKITAHKPTLKIVADGDFTYDGNEHKPTVTIYDASVEPNVLISSSEYYLDFTSSDCVNASNNIVFTVKDNNADGNYDIDDTNASFVIKARPVTIKSKDDTKVYDGTPLRKEEFEVVSLLGFVGKQGVDAKNFAERTEVGSTDNKFNYVFNAATKASNYDLTVQYGQLVVTRRTTTLTVEISPSEFTYNGAAQKPTSIVVKDDLGNVIPSDSDEYIITYVDTDANSDDITNVGNKAVVITDNKVAGGNYEWTEPVKVAYVINPATVEVVWNTNEFTYDGAEHTVFATVRVPGLSTTSGLYGSDVCNVTKYSGTTTAVESNSYTAWADQIDNSNYKLPESTDKCKNLWTIQPKSIEIDIDVKDVTYNGSAQEPAVVVTIHGTTTVIDSEEYTLSWSKNTNVGTATVTVSNNISGSSNNYTIVTNSKNFQIKPAKLTVNGTTVQTKEYDGSLDMTVVVGSTINGIQGTDVITLTATGTLDDKHASTTTKDVNVSYTIDGAKKANYVIDDEVLQGTVNKRPLTLLSNSESKSYNGTPLCGKNAAPIDGTSYVAGEELDYTFTSCITEVGSIANEYTVASSATALLSDYQVVPKQGTLTIEAYAGTQEINYSAGPYTYTAEAIKPTVNIYIDGKLIPDSEYDVYYADSVNVGTATIIIVPTPKNYSVETATRSYTIVPAVLTVSHNTIGSAVYDGTTNVPGSLGTVAGFQGEDASKVNVSLTMTVDKPDALLSQTVHCHYALSSADGSDSYKNYTIADEDNGTFAFVKRPVRILSATDSKPFDNTPLTAKTVETKVGVYEDVEYYDFVDGEYLTYDVNSFASITRRGFTNNTFTYAAAGNFDADNYILKVQYGTLTITEYDLKGSRYTAPISGSFTYNGLVQQPMPDYVQDIIHDIVLPETAYRVEYANNLHATTLESQAKCIVVDDDPDDDFKIETKEISFSINKRQLDLVWSEPHTFTYDGDEHTQGVELGNVPERDKPYLTFDVDNNKAVEEGTYTATVSNIRSTNAEFTYISDFILPSLLTTPWEIVAKSVDYSIILLDNDLVYNALPQEPRIQVKDSEGHVIPEDRYTVVYSNNTNAGSQAKVTVTRKSGSGYNLEEKSIFFTIKPATLTVSATWDDVKDYDGTTAVNNFSYVVNGLQGSETEAQIGFKASAAYNNANAGVGKTIKASYDFTSTNYTIADKTPTLSTKGEIKAIQLTADIDLITEKVYDGNKSVQVTINSISGVLPADLANVSVTATATYDDANVGDNHVITVEFAISGSASGNYLAPVDQAVPNCKITQPTAEDVLTAITKTTFTYGDARVATGDLEVSLVTSATPGFATGSFNYIVDGATNATAGTLLTKGSHTYQVVYTNANLVEVSTPVYTIIVNAKTLTVSGTKVADKYYDSTIDATVTDKGQLVGVVTPDGANVDFTASAKFRDAEVGSNKTVDVTYALIGDDAENYALNPNGTATASINAVDESFNFTVDAVKYGDKILSKLHAVYTGGTIVDGTYSYYFVKEGGDELISASTMPVPGNYQVYAVYTDGHLVATSEIKNVTVDKADFVPTFTLTTSKEYDGNNKAAISLTQGTKVKPTDDIKVTAVATYNDAKVGSNKDITIVYTKSGLQSDYYNVVDPAVQKGEITNPTVSWIVSNDTYTYGVAKIGENVKAEVNKVIDGATYTYVVNGSALAAGSLISAGTNIPVTVTLTNPNGVNLSTDFTVSVNRKSVSVANSKTKAKDWDGNDVATLDPVGDMSGVLTADVAEVTLTYTAHFDNANPGTGKSVFVDFDLTGAKSDNYVVTDITLTDGEIYKRNRVEADYAITDTVGIVYDGNEHPARIVLAADNSVTVSEAVLQYKTAANPTWTSSKPVDADYYYVLVTIPATSDFNELVINKWGYRVNCAEQAAPVLTGGTTSSPVASDGKITGLTTAMEYRLAGSTTFIKVTEAKINSGFAAGTYEVRYAAKTNYYASPITTVTVTLGDKVDRPGTYKFEGTEGLVYTASEKTITVTLEGSGTVANAQVLYSTDGTTWNTNKPYNAGHYYVKATVPGDAQYKDLELAPIEFDVAKAKLTPVVTSVTKSKVYDSTTDATAAFSLNSGTNRLQGSDKAEDVNFNATVWYDTKNVGENKTIFAQYTISSINYELTQTEPLTISTEGVIIKATLTVDADVELTKDYDGNKTAVVNSAYIVSGLYTGDVVTVSATATFDSPAVGSRTVNVDYELSGADSNNYKVTTPVTKSGSITQPALTWTVLNPDKVFGSAILGSTVKANVTGDDEATAYTYTYKVNGTTRAAGYLIPKGEDIAINVVATNAHGVRTETNFTVNVSAKELTVVNMVVDSKTYDEDKVAHISKYGHLEGVVLGTTVAIDESNTTAFFANALPEDNKDVTVTVALAGSDASNYFVAPIIIKANISKLVRNEADYTITYPADLVYNGSAKPVTISGPDANKGTISYSTDNGTSWTTTEPVDANTYRVKFEIAEDATHKPLVIERADWEYTIQNASQDKPVVSGQNTSDPVANDGKIIGLDTTMEFRKSTDSNYTPVTDPNVDLAPGTYYVRYPAKPNYNASPDAIVTIGKGDKTERDPVNYTVTLPENLVYDATDKIVTASGPDIDHIEFSTDGGLTWTTALPHDAGDYKIRIHVKETEAANAAVIEKSEWAFSITQATLTPIAHVDNPTKTYDGTVATLEGQVSFTFSGLCGSDNADGFKADVTYDNKNVGNAKDLNVDYTLVNKNYQLSKTEETLVGKGNIVALQLTATATVQHTKQYDGNKTATVLTKELFGVIAPDDVTLLIASAQYDEKTVGTHTITVTFDLSGADKNNYIVPVPQDFNGEITQPSLSWAPSIPVDPIYGEAVIGTTVNVTLLGNPAGYTYTYVVDGVAQENGYIVTKGDHQITVTAKNADGVVLTYTANLTVEPRVLTVSGAKSQAKNYDGNTDAELDNQGTLVNTVPGTSVSFDPDLTVAKLETAMPGTNKKVFVDYVLTGADKDNYVIYTQTLTDGVIYKLERLVADYTLIKPEDLVYNGSEKLAAVSGPNAEKAVITYNSSATVTWTDRPVNVATYDVKVVIPADDIYKELTITSIVDRPEWAYSIVKAEQLAPEVYGVATSNILASDGKIAGLATTMEVSSDGGATYTSVVNINQPYAAGTYHVRYKETANYNASPATEVTIDKGPKIARNADDYTLVKPTNLVYDGSEKLAQLKKNGTVVAEAVITYSTNGGTSWDATPVDVNHYDVKVLIPEDEVYTELIISSVTNEGWALRTAWAYDITKAKPSAPVLQGQATSFVDTADGKILGLTTDMELRAEGQSTYTKVTDVDADFAAGTYYVRYIETDNFQASDDATVVVAAGPKRDRNAADYTIDGTNGLVYNGEEKVITVSGPNAENATLYFSTNGGESWTTSKPVDAADYIVKVIIPEDAIYNSIELTKEFTVAKATQNAPVVEGRATSSVIANDGHIVPLTNAMEYRKDGEENYTKVTNPNVELPAGDYYVRYAEIDNYFASPDTKVTIDKGPKLVRNEADYVIHGTENLVYDGHPKDGIYVTGPDAELATLEFYTDVLGDWSTEWPLNADYYYVRVTIPETETHEELVILRSDWAFPVAKAAQLAPAVTGIDCTTSVSADGHFVDATTQMEYRLEGESNYVAVTDPNADLAAGVYYIRMVETDNYAASPDTKVTIAKGPKQNRNAADYTIEGTEGLVYDGNEKTITVSGPDAENASISFSTDGGATWTTDKPVDADDYIVKVIIPEDEVFNSIELTKEFTVVQATQKVPDVEGIATSSVLANDGHIGGLTTAMEYRKEGEENYTKVTDPDVELPAGDYYVRYAETDNYFASDDTKVTIDKGPKVARNEADYAIHGTEGLVYDGQPKNGIYVTGPDAEKAILEFYTETSGEWTTEWPLNADIYSVRVTIPETDTYEALVILRNDWAFPVAKAAQDAPDVTGKDCTTPISTDGHFVGATTDMEYRLEGEATYVTVTDPDVDLAPGVYYIRKSETDNYLASADTKVTIEKGPKQDRNAADYAINGTENLVYDGTEKVITVSGPDVENAIIEFTTDGGLTWTEQMPIDADDYTVRVTIPATEVFNELILTEEFTVDKAQRPAPDVTGKNATTTAAADGHFVGATTEMEYRTEGETEDDFKAIIDPDMNLAPGYYYVRYPETKNYYASPETEVLIIDASKQDRDINDYYVLPPANNIYDGTEKEATAVGPGDKTLYYSTDGGQTWTTDLPVLPGHYDCLIKVEGDDEYNPAEFTKPEWGFDILKPGTEFIKATNFVVNATGYCAGDMAHVTFDVEVGEPTAYRLVFEAENKAINDIEFEPLEGGQYAIDFDIPDYVAGQYNLFVQFRDNDFRLSTVYSVPLHIDLTNEYLTDIWEDVVSVINKVDLSQPDNMTERFTAFQWYFNGEIIEGKAGTKPYYCQEGGLDGTYQLKVVTIDDETLFTCPKTFTPKNNKALSLKVYPNPVRSVVNIELSEDNDETHNLVITDNNGTVVVRTTFTGPLTQYDLSSAVVGHYVIMVDGLSVSVVKN